MIDLYYSEQVPSNVETPRCEHGEERQFFMSRTLQSPKHETLRAFLVEKRHNAGLTQAEVATALGRHQSFIATVESGQRRIDVVELLQFAEAIGFDPHAGLRRMMK